MDIKELSYPAIMFCKQGIVEVVEDADTMTTATTRELKIGWFNGINVVDVNGKTVKIKEARYISGRGPFWGWTSTLMRFVRVELIANEVPADMPFEEIKKKASAHMKRWASSVVGEKEYRGQIRKADDAKTIRELIEILEPHSSRKQLLRELGLSSKS